MSDDRPQDPEAKPDSRIWGFTCGDPFFHTHPELLGACSTHDGGQHPHAHVR